jgi:hypothetical protein
MLAVHLQSFAVDPFPDLRVRGCALVVVFATSTPEVFKHYAIGMVKALKTGLDHRHAKVRTASLDAVDACVTCPDKAKARGAGSAAIHELAAFQDPNTVPVSAFYRSDARINYFAKLGADTNALVSRATDSTKLPKLECVHAAIAVPVLFAHAVVTLPVVKIK